jgi:predicted nucleic acid-binding protein
MITSTDIHLVGDLYLVEEMIRYAEEYQSETAATLLQALASKINIIQVEPRYTKICKQYITTDDLSDILHAAACLQSDATLITDDHHFNNIRDEGIINVQSTKDAIKTLLGF